MLPLVTGGNPMMAFHYKKYNVLMDPRRLVDVIADPNIQLAVGTNEGKVIAALNVPASTGLAHVLTKQGTFVSDDYIVAQARDDVWTTAALMPRADIFASLRREQMLLLPLGAIIAAALDRNRDLVVATATVSARRTGNRDPESGIHRPLSTDRRARNRHMHRRRGIGALETSGWIDGTPRPLHSACGRQWLDRRRYGSGG